MRRSTLVVICGLLFPATALGAAFDERAIPKSEVREVTASSTSDETLNGRLVYRTRALVDGVMWSPWGEGVIGNGVGEKVRIDLGGTRYLTKVAIANGNQRDFRAFKDNGRAKDVLVRFRGAQRELRLKDTQAVQTFDLGSPVETDFVEIEFRSRHKGGTGPLCLSEVILYEPKDILALRPEMRSAIETAVKDLAHPERGRAAVGALATIGPPVVPWLVALKDEKDPETRRRVAIVLGKTGVPGATTTLQHMYTRATEVVVKETVLEAFGHLRSPRAVPFLLPIATGKDKVLARKALVAMEGIGDIRTLRVFLNAVMEGDEALASVGIRHLAGFGPDAVKALKPFLRDRRENVRARAVWALGRVGGVEAQPILVRHINTGTLPIMLAGLRGLGETRSAEAFDTLSLNVEHEHEQVRTTVAKALANFSTTSSAQILEGMIRRDVSEAVREAAWSAMPRLGPPGLSTLKRLVLDGKADQRNRALDILAKLRFPGALEAITDLLGDPRPPLRRRATKILAERRDGGLKAFVKALGHDDSQVRFVAARYLTNNGRTSVPLLVKAVRRSNEPAVRIAGLKALAEIGDPRGAPAVLAGMNASNRKVRRAAVTAAERVPSDIYGKRLMQLLDDDDANVRLGAVEAVGASRYKPAAPTLIQRLSAGDPNGIRIIWALGEIREDMAVPALTDQLQLADAFTREMAVEALGKIGGRRALGVLLDAMLDSNASVRKKAETALSR